MRNFFVRCLGALAVLAAFGFTPLQAQNGTITGTVTDAETGAVLSGVSVQVLGTAQATGALTDAEGRFRIQIAPGTYSLVAQYIGYRQAREDGVSVSAGQPTNRDFALTSTQFALNPIVVTASRRQEKALESPSNVVTIGEERISERSVTSIAEHVKTLPGVDVVQGGLTQTNIVTRGFNNVFSGALLVLTDNRYASVPSLRFNAYNFIPINQFDIERMEVLLGPAAALYGPNSSSGVLHMITSSPLREQGTKASISAGERDVLQTQFRTSHLLSENVGLKVSGQYMQGTDWMYEDPAEDPTDPPAGAGPDQVARIGARDFDMERWGGEVRLDVRTSEDSELIFNAGLNNMGSSIELTGIGAGQASDWKYSYFQTRFSKDRLFAQAFINQSDAGDSFLLRTGQPIVDKSRLMAFQFQNGFSVGDSQDFIYGIDLSRTEPRTEGTITGRNEDDDTIDEIGGYVHSETDLTDKVTLVAALRVDDHNRLEDVVFSPRAALVFNPAENQTFRLTYNRAFSTPTTNNLFLDLIGGAIGPYNIRTLGVPAGGFTFDDRCQGGIQDLCMYSPFNPAGPGEPLPAVAPTSVYWNGFVAGVLGPTNPLVPALQNPGAVPGETVPTSGLVRFNQESRSFPADDGPEAIAPIAPTIYNNFEIGYKGLIGDRLLVSADLYSQRIKDFVGPLRTETPTVNWNAAQVQAFVLGRLGPAIQAGQVTQQQATQIIQALAGVPVGTVAPDQAAGLAGTGTSPRSTDLILTYRNFGDVDLWGADLAFQFLATDRLSFTGSYSHVSEECFDFDEDGGCSSARDIALNAPANKGALGIRWDDKVSGISIDGRIRMTEEFRMNSGVYIGTVEGYHSIDLNVGYQLPFATGATLTFTATNVTDNVHREFVGVPQIGRLMLVRLLYEF